MTPKPEAPAVRLRDASLRFGERVLFEHLDLDVGAGEFVAVLGPNGSGKTSLLRVLLGLSRLSAGTVEVQGGPPHRTNGAVGYVPQQYGFERDLSIRGRDLVRFGLDGHRAGLPLGARRTRALVDDAIAAVGAEAFAHVPIGLLSGGEQQRLRIAQALVGDPAVLLCDEPLLSLDLSQQQVVSRLINERRQQHGTAVFFVTHEINPVLAYVDRVLYLVGGRWAVGTAAEVLTSERLSDLFGAPIDVLEIRGRIVVVGGGDDEATEPSGHHHHHHVHHDGGHG